MERPFLYFEILKGLETKACTGPSPIQLGLLGRGLDLGVVLKFRKLRYRDQRFHCAVHLKIGFLLRTTRNPQNLFLLRRQRLGFEGNCPQSIESQNAEVKRALSTVSLGQSMAEVRLLEGAVARVVDENAVGRARLIVLPLDEFGKKTAAVGRPVDQSQRVSAFDVG